MFSAEIASSNESPTTFIVDPSPTVEAKPTKPAKVGIRLVLYRMIWSGFEVVVDGRLYMVDTRLALLDVADMGAVNLDEAVKYEWKVCKARSRRFQSVLTDFLWKMRFDLNPDHTTALDLRSKIALRALEQELGKVDEIEVEEPPAPIDLPETAEVEASSTAAKSPGGIEEFLGFWNEPDVTGEEAAIVEGSVEAALKAVPVLFPQSGPPSIDEVAEMLEQQDGKTPVISKNMGGYTSVLVFFGGRDSVKKSELYRIEKGVASHRKNTMRSRKLSSFGKGWVEGTLVKFPQISLLRAELAVGVKKDV